MFKLREGEVWTIVNINTSDGYQAVENPLDKAYTVTSDDDQNPDVWKDLVQ